jgi:pimeloyl-ACP methyl ester carboxylesterase
MHNPRLKRWPHRADLSTLLPWGAEDGLVTPNYGEGWQRAIPGGTMELISGAGHFPHREQPEQFVQRLSKFFDRHNA